MSQLRVRVDAGHGTPCQDWVFRLILLGRGDRDRVPPVQAPPPPLISPPALPTPPTSQPALPAPPSSAPTAHPISPPQSSVGIARQAPLAPSSWFTAGGPPLISPLAKPTPPFLPPTSQSLFTSPPAPSTAPISPPAQPTAPILLAALPGHPFSPPAPPTPPLSPPASPAGETARPPSSDIAAALNTCSMTSGE